MNSYPQDLYTQMPNQEGSEKIELHISCRKLWDRDLLSKSDPQVTVKKIGPNGPEVIGSTERIKNNLNPNFTKTFTLPYQFSLNTLLRLEVFDSDGERSSDYIGATNIELGAIVGSPGCMIAKELENPSCRSRKYFGTIIVKAVKIEESKEEITFSLRGRNIKNIEYFSKSDPFFKVFRKCENGNILVYQTENLRDNLNPVFRPVKMTMGKLCGNYKSAPLICEVWDYESSGKHRIIGRTNFTLDQVINGTKEFVFMLEKHVKPRGTMEFVIQKIDPLYSFLDYIKGGQQLLLSTAVDFTASNYLDNQPSLHLMTPGNFNQ